MSVRPDYCPIGGEPCQSLCATPCSSRKPLTDEQIETMVQQDETLRYHFALNGGAGPVSEKGKKIIRAVQKALAQQMAGEQQRTTHVRSAGTERRAISASRD